MAVQQFIAHYSESVVRLATRRYFGYLLRREFNMWLYVAVAALVGLLTYDISRGSSSWREGALGAALVILAMLVWVAYQTHMRLALSRFRQMQEPVANFRVTDEDLTVSSNGASSTIPLGRLDLVLEFGEVWIFRLKDRSTFTLPTNGVGEEALEFLRGKLRGVIRAA